MSKTTSAFQKQLVASARRSWIFILVGLLAILLALPISTTIAAPTNQTVPIPTPEDTPAPVPTATSTSRTDDGDDDDSSSEPATPIPDPVVEVLTAVVTVDQLNVRGGPSVQYTVVGKVNIDDTLTVLGRNESGDWWFICCSADSGAQGWVSTQFLTPNFSDEQANDLPVVPANGPPPTPEPVSEPQAVTETEPVTDTVPVSETEPMPAFALELSMAQSSFSWQGQEMDLKYVITNPSDEDALNVELRNELPALLSYIDAAAGDGGKPAELTLANGSTVFGIEWPLLAAGQQVTGTITLLISADAPNGAVIQNIAVAGADNAQSVSAGINIGMPPAILPDFR